MSQEDLSSSDEANAYENIYWDIYVTEKQSTDTLFKWNDVNTSVFLDKYESAMTTLKTEMPTLLTPTQWSEIKSEMQKMGYNVTPEIFTEKMESMQAAYTKILKEHNARPENTIARIHWKHFIRAQKMFGDNDKIPLNFIIVGAELSAHKSKAVSEKVEDVIEKVEEIVESVEEKEESEENRSEEAESVEEEEDYSDLDFSMYSDNSSSGIYDPNDAKDVRSYRKRKLEIENDKVDVETEKVGELKKLRQQMEIFNSTQKEQLQVFQRFCNILEERIK